MFRVNIIGAGLAGLSAAITLAENGISSRLISRQPSERAQSVLAEGGINAALDSMGEGDRPELHMQDTIRSGGGIADPEAVRGLAEGAPGIVRRLIRLGVPFQVENGVLMQRPFGGQKKSRTVYAKSSTGKIVMTALISEVRRYETEGTIERFSHHVFAGILTDGHTCGGVIVKDDRNGQRSRFYGPVILALGGMNGFFPGMTTGTTANTGDAQSILFLEGVRFGNLEMIQYHPTTMKIPGKRCLVSEAARGEGGRLFVMRGGRRWYFMEEKYPELGNLMPRDVVSREMYFVLHDPECGDQVYLDMTGLSSHIWKSRLADLREEIQYYQGIDPKLVPLPVDPGIHYFMGGIDVDIHHRTNIAGLYAAGECCCQYHGANRLGGNSMLGALYGGKTAAEDLASRRDEFLTGGGKTPKPGADRIPKLGADRIPEPGADKIPRSGADKTPQPGMEGCPPERAYRYPSGTNQPPVPNPEESPEEDTVVSALGNTRGKTWTVTGASFPAVDAAGKILVDCMGIVRNEASLRVGLDRLSQLEDGFPASSGEEPDVTIGHIELARAMILSALIRKESCGAHYRSDYPERDPAYEKQTVAQFGKEGITVAFTKKG